MLPVQIHNRERAIKQQELMMQRAKKVNAEDAAIKRSATAADLNTPPRWRKKRKVQRKGERDAENWKLLTHGETSVVLEQLTVEKEKAAENVEKKKFDADSVAELRLRSQRLSSYQISLQTSRKTRTLTSPRSL